MHHSSHSGPPPGGVPRWSDEVFDRPVASAPRPGALRVLTLPGEGVGPEVVGAALDVLRALEAARPGRTFGYDEADVRRLARVASRLAARRGGVVSVVVKDGGVPTVSRLWRDCATDVAAAHGVRARFLNVDLAAYALVQDPRTLDVV